MSPPPPPPLTAAQSRPFTASSNTVLPGTGMLGGSTIVQSESDLAYLPVAEQNRLQSRKFLVVAFYFMLCALLIFIYLLAPTLRVAHPEIHDILYNLRLLLTVYLGVQTAVDVTSAFPSPVTAYRQPTK